MPCGADRGWSGLGDVARKVEDQVLSSSSQIERRIMVIEPLALSCRPARSYIVTRSVYR